MSVRLYMDVHVPVAITTGLKLRGVDVLTAQIDDAVRLYDPDLLDRAMTLERLLFSQDADLLQIANERLRSGALFAGLVYAHQLRVNIGMCVADLELIAKGTDQPEWRNQIVFLPL